MTLTVASVIMARTRRFRSFTRLHEEQPHERRLQRSLSPPCSSPAQRPSSGGSSVAVCPSANPGNNVPACTASFNGNGWVVWDDADRDVTKAIDAGEAVLGRHDAARQLS